MTATMEGLVLHALGDLKVEKIPRPEPKAGEVLVKVAWCGVCGSDIPRTYTKGPYKFPLICGHEFAGTIAACGADVSGYTVGEKVAVFPLLWCGKCPACETGQYAQCFDYDYLGSRSNGAFAEYVAAPVKNLLKVPANVSLEEAAMTEPASVALHAVRRGGKTGVGETAVIFGAGPIGLMLAQWCRAYGAAQVLLFDIDPLKLDLARKLNFKLAFNSKEVDPVKVVNDHTGGKGAHLVIEGAGVPSTMIQALDACGRGGRVVIMGNPIADVSIPVKLISQAMRREINIVGTWNSVYSATGNDNDWRDSLDAMASGLLNLKPLITHKVPVAKGVEAFSMIKDRKEFSAKVLIGNG